MEPLIKCNLSRVSGALSAPVSVDVEDSKIAWWNVRPAKQFVLIDS